MGQPIPKPEPRKRTKARKDRLEARVKRQVRAACVERDGECLVATRAGVFGECGGVPEFAHLAGHRRSQTRKMPATYRHNTAWTAILCTRHHEMEEKAGWRVIYKTVDYADGPVGWGQMS